MSTRDQNPDGQHDALALSTQLQAKQVDLVVLDQGIDTSTAVGRMFVQILGAIVEFEHALMASLPVSEIHTSAAAFSRPIFSMLIGTENLWPTTSLIFGGRTNRNDSSSAVAVLQDAAQPDPPLRRPLGAV